MNKTKLTIEQANQMLRDRCLNGHQYNALPGGNYYPMQIKPLGKEYRLIGGREGTRPMYQGSLKKCLKEALYQVESANYYLECQAASKCHPFCYLPGIKSQAPNAYPASA